MKLRDNLIKLIFILLIFLKLINAQLNPQNIAPSANAEKCKERGEKNHARKFEDCKSESNQNNTCCFITGTYYGEKYEGCIAMDAEIFANRSVKYNFNSISATLICQDNYNFEKFINNRFFLYFYLFILILLF